MLLISPSVFRLTSWFRMEASACVRGRGDNTFRQENIHLFLLSLACPKAPLLQLCARGSVTKNPSVMSFPLHPVSLGGGPDIEDPPSRDSGLKLPAAYLVLSLPVLSERELRSAEQPSTESSRGSLTWYSGVFLYCWRWNKFFLMCRPFARVPMRGHVQSHISGNPMQ